MHPLDRPGERMHPPGYTEVSGVCTHPDFRGRGLARQLSAAVAMAIEARSERLGRPHRLEESRGLIPMEGPCFASAWRL